MVGPGFFDDDLVASDDEGIAPDPFVFNHARWEQLRREQLGVNVIDPLGHEIALASAMNFRPEGVPLHERQVNWTPVDRVKHVLVGELDHFYISDAAGFDEWDYNICIAPDPPFERILVEGAGLMSEEERRVHLVEDLLGV